MPPTVARMHIGGFAPAPPGPSDDPVLAVMQKHLGLNTPTTKIYYEMWQNLRDYGPDQFEKGDRRRLDGFREAFKNAIIRAHTEQSDQPGE